MQRDTVMPAGEAVRIIVDCDTITTSGVVGSGLRIAMASARSQARSNLPRQDAEALAEDDAAKAAEAAAAKSPNEVAEAADELLDEIDALLEEQSVLTNFRQKGGQ